MTAPAYDFHHRRTRQHRLFALSATCPEIRRSHRQLAQAHWAAASYVHGRSQGKPQA